MRLKQWILARVPSNADLALRWWGLVLYLLFMVGANFLWASSSAAVVTSFSVVFYFGAGIAAALLVGLWRGGGVATTARVAMATTLVFTTLTAFFTGGVSRTNVTSFLIIVVVSVFLLGRRGYVWAFSAVAVCMAFQVAEWVGHPPPDVVPPAYQSADAFITWFISTAVIFSFIVAYDVARRRAMARLEANDRSKTLFLANLSHEIRNPLQAVVGTNSLLLQTSLDDLQRQYVETARQAAGGLVSFLNGVLDFTALEQGFFKLESGTVAVRPLVEETANVVRFLCERKQLDFEVVVDGGVPERIHGDARRIRQILMNLGENAAKFTDHGGVALRVEYVDETTLRFIIRDSGVGVAKADQERIFEGFERVGVGRVDGTGLGLSISNVLATLMGGCIRLESTPGEGSTFTVDLPLPALDDESTEPTENDIREVRGLCVLLVEDLDVNRELTSVMLKSLGHQVIEAQNGQEAIELWEQDQPDLVFMDVRMPGLDGLAATRIIREREVELQRQPVRIVAMTGQASTDQRSHCLQAGMDQCLFKPFDLDQLAAAISRPDTA